MPPGDIWSIIPCIVSEGGHWKGLHWGALPPQRKALFLLSLTGEMLLLLLCLGARAVSPDRHILSGNGNSVLGITGQQEISLLLGCSSLSCASPWC